MPRVAVCLRYDEDTECVRGCYEDCEGSRYQTRSAPNERACFKELREDCTDSEATSGAILSAFAETTIRRANSQTRDLINASFL